MVICRLSIGSWEVGKPKFSLNLKYMSVLYTRGSLNKIVWKMYLAQSCKKTPPESLRQKSVGGRKTELIPKFKKESTPHSSGSLNKIVLKDVFFEKNVFHNCKVLISVTGRFTGILV